MVDIEVESTVDSVAEAKYARSLAERVRLNRAILQNKYWRARRSSR